MAPSSSESSSRLSRSPNTRPLSRDRKSQRSRRIHKNGKPSRSDGRGRREEEKERRQKHEKEKRRRRHNFDGDDDGKGTEERIRDGEDRREKIRRDYDHKNDRKSKKGSGGRNRRSEGSSRRRRHDGRRRDREENDSQDDSSSENGGSTSTDDHRRKKRQHVIKSKRRRRRRYDDDADCHSRKKRAKRRESGNDDDDDENENDNADRKGTNPLLPLHQEICRTLHRSFSSIVVASEKDGNDDLVPLLISVLSTLSSRGGSIDTSRLTQSDIRYAIESFLASLYPLGVSCAAGSCKWRWDLADQHNGGRVDDGKALLRMIEDLMNAAGATLDNIEKYEKQQQHEQERQEELQKQQLQQIEEKKKIDGVNTPYLSALADLLSLSSSSKKVSGGTPVFNLSLAGEISTLLKLILHEGELAIIDGIRDDTIRNRLHVLFRSLGCVEVEVEDEKDECNDEDTQGCWGYGLPEEIIDGDQHFDEEMSQEPNIKPSQVADRIRLVLSACESRAVAVEKARRMKGPAMPPPSYQLGLGAADDDDEEEIGPIMPGSGREIRALSADHIEAMAERTALELAVAAGKKPRSALENTIGGGKNMREEWMITPGEYNYLDGVQGKTVGRTFKNEKGHNREGRSTATMSSGVSSETQEEMKRLAKEHTEKRGPSLVDLHRQKKQKEKEKSKEQGAGRGSRFNWNRENDLDAGRRVDKNYLAMVLGGAKDGLQDKFHGNITKGFM